MLSRHRLGSPVGRVAVLTVLLIAGCASQPRVAPSVVPAQAASHRPLAQPGVAPAGAVARQAPPIVGFVATADALAAFRRACPRLLKRADTSGLTEASDWSAACTDAGSNSAADPASFFQRHFTPVRLGDGRGLATGYFEPEIAGLPGPAPGAAPILGRPPELVDIDLKDWSISGGTLRGMVREGRVVRAPDRAAIEQGALPSAQVLGWAADPVELFFLQIQGSGRVRLPDGTGYRIGYAAHNGHPYVAIGKLLRERGLLEKARMPEIMAWLRADPAAGAALMRENPSYIFFRRLPDNLDGPIGALGVPLIAGANAAADPATLPLGAPVWIGTEVEGAPFRRLLVAADTGGAIKGANRFDIFFGFGAKAGAKAGALAAPLTATLLLPNAAAARLAPPPTP